MIGAKANQVMELVGSLFGARGDVMHINKEIQSANNASAFVSQHDLLALPAGGSTLPELAFVVTFIFHAAFVMARCATKNAASALYLTWVSFKFKTATLADSFYLRDCASASRRFFTLPNSVTLVFPASLASLGGSVGCVERIPTDTAGFGDFAAAIVSIVFAFVLVSVDKSSLWLTRVFADLDRLTAAASA